MTNLWMDPAVDPASERPVAAAAGLWTAEAKHGRAEVLTQWGKNLMQWKKINGVEIKIIAEMSLPLNVHTCQEILVAPTRRHAPPHGRTRDTATPRAAALCLEQDLDSRICTHCEIR